MTTTQLKGGQADLADVIVPDAASLRMPDAGEPDAEELRLLALEIIMYDPELAKQLVRAGVQKVLDESPTASG